MEINGEVDDVSEFCMGAGGSTNAVVNVAEVEFGDRVSVHLEEGLFDGPYKGAGIAGIWRKWEESLEKLLRVRTSSARRRKILVAFCFITSGREGLGNDKVGGFRGQRAGSDEISSGV